MDTKWLLIIMALLSVNLAFTQIYFRRFILFYNQLPGDVLERVPLIFDSHLLWITLVGFLISVSLWLWVLPRARLAVAYPMVSLSYVAMLFLAHFLENEPIHWTGIAGVVLIVSGVVLLSW